LAIGHLRREEGQKTRQGGGFRGPDESADRGHTPATEVGHRHPIATRTARAFSTVALLADGRRLLLVVLPAREPARDLGFRPDSPPAVELLDLPDQDLSVAPGPGDVVVRQPSPLLADAALELVPLALQDVLDHRVLLLLDRSSSPTYGWLAQWSGRSVGRTLEHSGCPQPHPPSGSSSASTQ